ATYVVGGKGGSPSRLSSRLMMSFAEGFQIVRFGTREQIEERIETSIERPAQLKNRSVERVQREAGRRSVGERQFRVCDVSQRPLRNEANPIDERVASHSVILEPISRAVWRVPACSIVGSASCGLRQGFNSD